ncbi:MAG: 4-hydroxy-tetrahydrodipicolinate reductase [Bacteroidetes bacterium]|nr:4-hydroxy-tetrahydrodipicolinate reductase [Bacteroidota bacterium]
MKLALIGYGKMGKTIERLAIERGHQVVHRFNSANPVNAEALKETDAAIEFSAPHLAVEHISICLKSSIPVVVGTTGWYDHFEACALLAKETGTPLFTASNFSLGVNLFFALNEYLAGLMKAYPEYQAEIIETHHVHKKDAPSGTAITLAEGLIRQHQDYTGWKLSDTATLGNSLLPIHSLRIDEVPGTHEVSYRSHIDTLSITHTAHNRDGFALGAILAAEFIKGRSGVFGMKDLLQF